MVKTIDNSKNGLYTSLNSKERLEAMSKWVCSMLMLVSALSWAESKVLVIKPIDVNDQPVIVVEKPTSASVKRIYITDMVSEKKQAESNLVLPNTGKPFKEEELKGSVPSSVFVMPPRNVALQKLDRIKAKKLAAKKTTKKVVKEPVQETVFTEALESKPKITYVEDTVPIQVAPPVVSIVKPVAKMEVRKEVKPVMVKEQKQTGFKFNYDLLILGFLIAFGVSLLTYALYPSKNKEKTNSWDLLPIDNSINKHQWKFD